MTTPITTDILPPGARWSLRIPRQRRVRLTALDAGANLSALLYNAHAPLDRLNVPDTLKALHTAKLTRGHVLMTDLGHALASITDDSLGWHDPLGGHIHATQVEAKFGPSSYQADRNDVHRNAHDNFLIELGKHGLGLADIVANVNFFSKVTVDDAGRLSLVPDHCPAAATVDLRTETDVLLVLANCPHPLHPGGTYPTARVQIDIHECAPPTEDDYCRTFRPECARTLDLTQRLHL